MSLNYCGRVERGEHGGLLQWNLIFFNLLSMNLISESEAEAVLNSLWNILRRDGWTVADSNAFVTIFEKTLKDHGMLFKKNIKSSISEAEAVLNSFMESASSQWLDCHGCKTSCTFFKNI